MITLKHPRLPAPVKIQTYVLEGETLYKAGSQRMADAYSGRRAEPALAGKAVHLYTARIDETGVHFSRGAVVVFDEEGVSREDLARISLLSGMDKVSPSVFTAKLPEDAEVRAYLEAMARDVDPELLRVQASTAKGLPTRRH